MKKEKALFKKDGIVEVDKLWTNKILEVGYGKKSGKVWYRISKMFWVEQNRVDKVIKEL